jgi:BMFP domain-containing protein YqiC
LITKIHEKTGPSEFELQKELPSCKEDIIAREKIAQIEKRIASLEASLASSKPALEKSLEASNQYPLVAENNN